MLQPDNLTIQLALRSHTAVFNAILKGILEHMDLDGWNSYIWTYILGSNMGSKAMEELPREKGHVSLQINQMNEHCSLLGQDSNNKANIVQ